MSGRKIIDAADARRALAAVERSGARLGSWARAHGIDGRSLHTWKLNLARRVGSSQRRAHKELTLVEVVPGASSSPARYVLRRGDVAVEFGDDAREETLRLVVAVLRAC